MIQMCVSLATLLKLCWISQQWKQPLLGPRPLWVSLNTRTPHSWTGTDAQNSSGAAGIRRVRPENCAIWCRLSLNLTAAVWRRWRGCVVTDVLITRWTEWKQTNTYTVCGPDTHISQPFTTEYSVLWLKKKRFNYWTTS